MAMLSIVIFVFASLLLICGYLAQQDDTLLMVQIVGMLQHFELGKYFRKRYIEGEPYRLLNSSYSRYEVKIRSTDYDRTLMSAYSNLAGLYPPSGDQIWNKDLLWQPIPVHTVPQDTDYLLRVGGECPQYKEYNRAAMNSDECKKKEEENKEFYELLANKTGNEIAAWDVFDAIFCARTHGLLEPSWVNLTWKGNTIFDQLREIHNLQFDLSFNRPGESRLTGGPLLKEMIENMQSQMSTKSEFKSHIYSAHDTTVSAFLSALKVFNGIAPPYTSTVLLELHKIDGKYAIRVLYRNDSTLDAYSLQIPGCSDSCLFEDFINITKDNIPDDWHSECRTKSMPTYGIALLLGMVIISMSFLLVTILVYVVQRKRRRHKEHGDRSPGETFPTNPLSESAWPQGFSQLTQEGMVQHFELGKYFKKRYMEGEPYRLLNSSYSRYEVKLRSSDYDRTLMSAYSNLAGLYPPSGDQIWNKDLLWQPIPVHTVPQDTDYMLKVDVKCPKYDEYYQAALNSPDIQKEEAENKEFYEILSNLTGNHYENITQVWNVFDPIFCARTHGLLEPSWANMTWKGLTIYDKLSEIHALQFDVQYNRTGEQRLRGGPLLKEMIENMQSQMSKKSKFKIHFYSAHDSTVAAFLSALKVFNGITPPYSSTVLLELHKIDGKHVLHLLYRNDTTRDPYSFQIPGCSESCSFDEFVRITKDIIPGDVHAECQTKSMPASNAVLLLGMVIILVSFLLVTILVYAVLLKRGRHKGYVAYDGLIAKDDETF